MTIPLACGRLAVLSLLCACIASQPVAAQGLGVRAGLGVFRSHFTDPSRQSPGVGDELILRWAAPSGFVLGLGAHLIHFEKAMRGSAFLEARYAPAPSVERKFRPIIGGRLGPFVDDPENDPQLGVEAGTAFGLSFRVAAGVSLALTSDLTIELSSNDYANVTRRFFPGLMVGVVFQ